MEQNKLKSLINNNLLKKELEIFLLYHKRKLLNYKKRKEYGMEYIQNHYKIFDVFFFFILLFYFFFF